MKQFCLYNLEQTAVIVLDDAGIQYFNNTGGEAAIQSNATGFLVPVSNDPPVDQPELALAGRLSAAIRNQVGLTASQGDSINDLLRELSSTDVYSVNPNRLAESLDGWVFVRVRPQGEYSQFQGFDEFEAILTWPVSR